jgi:hypothetical protein
MKDAAFSTKQKVKEKDSYADVSPKETLVFRVAGLYGLSKQSIKFPLGNGESIDSGQICLTLDPESPYEGNLGQIDYERLSLKVRYTAQLIFPGLYELVNKEKFDPSLLNPVRVTATDTCKVFDDLSGWHAVGCLEFLPGSIWAGTSGG